MGRGHTFGTRFYIAPERIPLACPMASISSKRAFWRAAKFLIVQSHSPWRSSSVNAKDSSSPLVLPRSLFACSLSEVAVALALVLEATESDNDLMTALESFTNDS